MLSHLAASTLFGAGHVVRDGLPDLHTLTNGRLGTHAARAFGAALCGLGALAEFGPDWVALVLWLAVWAGFYLDQKHGEANLGAQPYALISGLSSVALAAIELAAFGYYSSAGLVLLVGCVKGPLWRECYTLFGDKYQPTRIAATAFGALFGLAV